MFSNLTGLQLTSGDGCTINIVDLRRTNEFPNWLSNGGGWWSSGPDYGSAILGGEGIPASSNSTGTCNNRSVFFTNSVLQTSDHFELNSHLCSPSLFAANVSVTVSNTQPFTTVTFDREEYNRTRDMLDSEGYRIPQFEDDFLSSAWSTKFPVFGHGFGADTQSYFAGPLLALAAGAAYNDSIAVLLSSTNLVEQARQLHQRYFGEMLLTTLTSNTDGDTVLMNGHVATAERRILVTTGVGISLRVLFLLLGVCCAVVTLYTRLSRRALNLYGDPGSNATTASLFVANIDSRTVFEGADRQSMPELATALRNATFVLDDGRLTATDKGSNTSVSGIPPRRSCSLSDTRLTISRKC